MNLPSSSTDQSKRHKLLFVTYGLVLLVFTVVLLELASWVVLKKTDQGESTYNGKRHLYHPYRSHQLNPDYKRDFDSNGNLLHSSDGFRGDQVYSKNKPENTFRILMMGGSTLYGISAAPPYERHPSLNNDETISYFLQQHLHNKIKETEADVTIEIINAAVTAYTTFHHLVYFNEVLFEYKPDLIIFLDGHNDFYYSEVYNNWQSYRQGTIRLVDHYNQRGFWFTSHTVARYLARFSRFFWLLETFMHRNWEPTGEPVFSQQDIPKELAGEFPDNMDTVLDETIFKSYRQFQALGELYNFEMMVFLQPQIVFEDPNLLSELDNKIQKLTLKHDKNDKRSDIRNLLPEKFSEHNIEFSDLAEIATTTLTDKQLYIDYCHLSPTGANVLANRMANPVSEKVVSMIAGATVE